MVEVKSEVGQRVCVVGAGLGGLAVAAILKSKGFDVEVHEKEQAVGGRCRSLTLGDDKGRYRFDVGASMLLMIDALDEMDEALGRKRGTMKNALELRQCFPSSAVYFEGEQAPMELSTDLHMMKSALIAACPDSLHRDMQDTYLRFLHEGRVHNRVAHSLILKQSFTSLCQAFSPKNIALAVTGLRNIGLYAYVRKMFKSPDVAKALSLQTMYMGLSPFHALSCYSMLVCNELTEGIWYPKGGMGSISELCKEILISLGGKVRLQSEVSKISFQRTSSLPVVHFTDGTEKMYDAVICNADLPYSYKNLIDDARTSAILDSMEYGCSTVSFYWGINKDLNDCLYAHQVFLGKSYEAAFKSIFQNRGIPESLSFYLHVSSKLDKKACPAGHTSLTVLVPVGKCSVSRAEIERCRAQILERLAENGIHIIAKDIVQEHVVGPDQWRADFNLSKGAALGLNHRLTQLGPFRPSNQDYKRRRLFFVGASTQPGKTKSFIEFYLRLARGRRSKRDVLRHTHRKARRERIEEEMDVFFAQVSPDLGPFPLGSRVVQVFWT